MEGGKLHTYAWDRIPARVVNRVHYGTRRQIQAAKDSVLRLTDRISRYEFNAAKYPEDFVRYDLEFGRTRPLDRVLYCFWTGPNPLTPNRIHSLERLRTVSSGLDVRLITSENLGDYLVPSEPLHPSYENLSYVHRSDYLRCYFMNFYGGGYVDVKALRKSWAPVFDRLESNSQAWAVGYPEVASNLTTKTPGRLGDDVRRHFSLLTGNGGFIMKAQTPLTREWYRELLARMDYYSRELERHPGNERGTNLGYPIPWEGILANILPPLILKYHRHVLQDRSLAPDFRNYQ